MLCLATATNNFKQVNIAYIYSFWKHTIANLDVQTLIKGTGPG